MILGWSPVSAQTIRPGLERIRAAFDLSGHPERELPSIQVAGTNGKGSTAAVLAGILGRIGPPFTPVALYTSPHLLSPRERIRVGKRMIPGRDLRRGMMEARRLSRSVERKTGHPMTFFEALTWVAVEWFRRKGTGIAVLEAGLGGRWDATTACRRIAAVITTVGPDHKEWLGGTIRRIAEEKAAILGTGMHVTVGRVRREARDVIRERAERFSCPVWELGRDFAAEADGRGSVTLHLPGLSIAGIRPGLRGAFQVDNAAVAAACAVRVAREKGVSDRRVRTAVVRGIEGARWPGRFDVKDREGPVRVILDGAHNVDAAKALAGELAGLRTGPGSSGVCCVFSMLADKDAGGFLRAIAGAVGSCIVYPLSDPRAASAENLARACRDAGIRCGAAADFGAAFGMARERAGRGGIVLVTGSLRTVADAFSHLGMKVA